MPEYRRAMEISIYIMSDRHLDESDRDLANTDQDFIKADFQISLTRWL